MHPLALVLHSRREPGCFMDNDSQGVHPGILNVPEVKSWELWNHYRSQDMFLMLWTRLNSLIVAVILKQCCLRGGAHHCRGLPGETVRAGIEASKNQVAGRRQRNATALRANDHLGRAFEKVKGILRHLHYWINMLFFFTKNISLQETLT